MLKSSQILCNNARSSFHTDHTDENLTRKNILLMKSLSMKRKNLGSKIKLFSELVQYFYIYYLIPTGISVVIEEIIVRFFRRSAKKYRLKKPISEGYKLFVLADSKKENFAN